MGTDKNMEFTPQYKMIDTLTQLYRYCYVIDLATQKFQKMDIEGAASRNTNDIGHCEDEREWFLQEIVEDTDLARMRCFTDLSTVRDRLQGKAWIYEDYINRMGVWTRAIYLPVTYDEQGTLTHVMFLGQKVRHYERSDRDYDSERERLSEENEWLQRANEQVQIQLETVLSGISGGYMICEDKVGFPFLYVSPAAAHNQGYDTVEEFLEDTHNSGLENIWQADRDIFLEKFYRQLTDKDNYSIKYRVRCKDGSPKWVMDTGRRMTDADGRQVIGFLLLDIDRHEKINQMYKLERSQYREALLSDSEYEYTLDLTADLVVSGYVRHPEKMAGAMRGKCYPIPINDEMRSIWNGFQAAGIDRDANSHLTTQTVKEAYKNGARNCELEYYDVRRKQYMRMTLLMSEREEDRHIIAIVIGRDITEQRLEQERSRQVLEETNEKLREACREAEAANAAKTDFLARMSHDIRTPLNGILGLLEIAGRCADDPDRVEDCRKKAVASANHLLSLLNDVLDMSKMESGELNLAEEPFDMNDVLRQTHEIMESQIIEKGIRTVISTPRALEHSRVIGSPLHVRQILTNLVSNAVKYNHVGGTISVTMEELSMDAQTVVFRFTISDTGIGMSEQFVAHIFEPFAREHNQGDEVQTGGTGLGMAIVKRIVDKMDGMIEVQSRLGEGSTFIVTLPFRRDTVQVPDVSDESEIRDDLRGVRILLVEDNELNREIAQYLLGDEGAEVELAVDGQEALEIFAAREPAYYDVILMDMMMPVLDGCSAARRLRNMERTDAQQIPIIALTANAFSDDVKRCREAGMDAHLAKPLDIRAAVRLIRKYVRSDAAEQ